jgi:DNA polymerase zeta
MYLTNYQVSGEMISSETSISAGELPAEAVQRHLNEAPHTGTALSHNMNEVSEVENPTPVRNNGNDQPSDDSPNTVLRQCVHRSNTQKSSSSVATPKSTAPVAPTAVHSSSSFPMSMTTNANAYVYALSPPSISELVGSLDEFAIPNKIYREAFYSNEGDALDKPREYAGLLYRLNGGDGLSTLDDWAGVQFPGAMGRATNGKGTTIRQCMQITSGGWEYADSPPSHREVKKWLTTDAGKCLLKTSKVPSQVKSRVNAVNRNIMYFLFFRLKGLRKPIHLV